MQKELEIVAQQSGLEITQSEMILQQFADFFEQAKVWETKAREIIVDENSDVSMIRQAREARLELKRIRIEAEKTRKRLKEKSIREGKAIEGIANVIKALVIPIEEHLEKQERFFEIKAEEQKRRITAERMLQLQPYVQDISVYNVADMSDEGFNQLLIVSKQAAEAQKEAKRIAEQKRIEKEEADKKENERIRLENEKLKKEMEAREREINKEREKEAAARKLLEEKQREEMEARKAAEKKLKEEKERQENEIKTKEEAERQAKLAPEKEKMFAFAESIRLLAAPTELSEDGRLIAEWAEMNLLKISQGVKEKIKNL